MDPSDEALIGAHLKGDAGAFAQIMRRYADLLLGYLTGMTSDRQLAEDLFQETFERVHQKAHAYQGRGKFKSWLFSIATNLAIDGLRKRKREPKMVSITHNSDNTTYGCTDGGCLALVQDRDANPYEAAVLDEKKAQVRQALDRLPPRQRATLILAYYQGRTYREVAEILDCSLGTVKAQMYRALRTLASLLPDMAGGDA